MTWIGYRRDPETARRIALDPELLDELLESESAQECVDLDKAWHGVHWLLTGSAEESSGPASDAILGGEPVGEDLGYGPAQITATAYRAATAKDEGGDKSEKALATAAPIEVVVLEK